MTQIHLVEQADGTNYAESLSATVNGSCGEAGIIGMIS